MKIDLEQLQAGIAEGDLKKVRKAINRRDRGKANGRIETALANREITNNLQ